MLSLNVRVKMFAASFLCAISTMNAMSAAMSAEEIPVTSRIESVGMFKNGIVVVQEEIAVRGGGSFIWEEVPSAIYGTFFIESDIESGAAVETLVTQREVTEQIPRDTPFDFRRDLAGREVRILGYSEPIAGKVMPIPELPQPARDAMTNSANNFSPPYVSYPESFYSAPTSDKMPIILETANGYTFLPLSSIQRFELAELPPLAQKTQAMTRLRDVMIFNVKSEKPAKIRLFYLARGMAWSPAYRINLFTPQRLRVEQSTLIKNEWRGIDAAEVSLISGFPRISCQNAKVPFRAQDTLAQLFQQLAHDASARRGGNRGNAIFTQQAVMISNSRAPNANDSPDFSAEAMSGEGPDIFTQNIGKRTLKAGDSLFLSLGQGEADYERIVEWVVPQTLDAFGRKPENNQYDNYGQKIEESSEPWDKIRFRNPLPFPMTTAPATITTGNTFYAQNTSFWVNPQEQTSLPITHSLSVRVRTEENRLPGTEKMRQSGYDYFLHQIEVRLVVVNHRAEEIKMVVKRAIWAQQLEQLENTKVDGVETSVRHIARFDNSPNVSYDVTWDFTIPRGASKEIIYSYPIWVRQ